MAQYAVLARDAGAHIIGGCCGTTPDHVRAMKTALESTPPGASAGAHAGRLVWQYKHSDQNVIFLQAGTSKLQIIVTIKDLIGIGIHSER